MIRQAYTHFWALRPPVRALVFLYWIYVFTMSLTWVFTQIFLYSKFLSLTLNTIAIIFLYTGIMVGFCVAGYVASVWNINIRHGFVLSFFVQALSFLLLLVAETPDIAYVAVFFNGVGAGLFWLTIHTFELSETRNDERDYYSSLLSAGDQVLALLGPAVATALIWVSGQVLHWGTFTLLFALTPCVYLLGFFCFSALRDYRPQPIEWGDIAHFFMDPRNRSAQVYAMGGGAQHVIGPIVMPVVSLMLLGTALNVGFYNTFVGIFSTLCVLIIAEHRTTKNRFAILAFATVASMSVYIILGASLSLTALIVYTIVNSLVSPLSSVSNHVIALESMESMSRAKSDFYATMIMRDFSLWVWRILTALVFLAVISQIGSQRTVLSLGLYSIAIALVVSLIGAKIIVMWTKKVPEAASNALDVPPAGIM